MNQVVGRPAAPAGPLAELGRHGCVRRVRVPLLALAVLLAGCSGAPKAQAPRGTQSFSDLSGKHVTSPVTYPQDPPVGGPHFPEWQNCGFYSEPVRNENAVHSMEHGAVWITYRPDLGAADQEKLRKLARQSYVLVAPYPGLSDAVVASAWGRQLRLPSVDDPRLGEFVRAFRQGPQTPEPGTPCTGGTAEPAR